MCIDYRKLNLCTSKDAISLARTDDVLEALGGGQCFSCLDLAFGYRQMQVKEEDRPKTAFSTYGGQVHWRVMPFGLTNGPASFTRLMNLVLSELTSTHCLAYLDDIIIWAPSLQEHLHPLRMILRYNVTRGGYTTMETPCLEGPDDNMGIVQLVLQQDYPKLRLLLETFRSVKP